jgi:hypothetical protein
VTNELRIAMWSGPRNISTAMMRSFGARAGATVVDEPFYAAYLAHTGLEHPMREEVLKSQPRAWSDVVAQLFAPLPAGTTMQYQKHMTHHMLPQIGRSWLQQCQNAFLIRSPAAVLASYVQKRPDTQVSAALGLGIGIEDIGLPQQLEIFRQVSDMLGRPAPVVDSDDVLTNPRAALSQLCEALGIGFEPSMLQWPAGRRDTDGVWAAAWYDAVERSTGFSAAKPAAEPVLTDRLRALADRAQPYYEELARYRIRVLPT